MKDVRVAAAGDVAPGEVKKVVAGARRASGASEERPASEGEARTSDRTLALVNAGGSFFALGDRCPHAGGPLSEGRLENGVLRCPWHARHFDPATGRCVDSEATRAAECLRTTVRDGQVFVEID